MFLEGKKQLPGDNVACDMFVLLKVMKCTKYRSHWMHSFFFLFTKCKCVDVRIVRLWTCHNFIADKYGSIFFLEERRYSSIAILDPG